MLVFHRAQFLNSVSAFEHKNVSGLVHRTIQKFSRKNRLRSSLVLCILLGLLFVLAYVLQTAGIIRHQKLRNSLEEQDGPMSRHLQEMKPRISRDLEALQSLKKKMNSNLWQQIIGHQAEKLERLSGSRNMNESTLRILERKGQDFYLNLLRTRGQLVESKERGTWIVSYPQTPVRLPSSLKHKSIQEWTAEEKIWINVTHFMWPNDEKCSKYSVRFSLNRPLPKIGLVSYPSSGNTWVRYLIEGLTGYFSGSMYNDNVIGKKGFCGESVPYDSGLSVVIKSHGHTTGKGSYDNATRNDQISKYDHITEFNGTAILLIRNPFKAIIGHRHLDEGGHVGLAPESQFVGEDWDYFVEKKTEHWKNLHLDWLSSGARVQVIHYENVRQNLEVSLRQISNFLGFSINENRLNCVLSNPVGHFLRAPRKKMADPFSSSQRSKILSAIASVNAALLLEGKEPLPLHKYNLDEA